MTIETLDVALDLLVLSLLIFGVALVLRIHLTTGVIGGAVAGSSAAPCAPPNASRSLARQSTRLRKFMSKLSPHSSGGAKRSRPVWATNRKQITSISRPRPAACRLPRRAKPLG